MTFQIDDCGPDATDSYFEATLTATNSGADPVDLKVRAAMLDELGDRYASLGTNENPLAIAPGATETTTIVGSAWHVDDVSRLADCRLFHTSALTNV